MSADRPDLFARIDPSDDQLFYLVARKVVHIDPGAIEALRQRYRELLPQGGTVLDLMSSWRSHLPDGVCGEVTGLGMNTEEMADNPQLDRFVVHDLNREPHLPFSDGSFDAVVCAVSVQYLVQPAAVFTDVGRLLRPGGLFIVSFSNRCFPTKAVAGWLYGSDAQHRAMVRAYFERSEQFDRIADEFVETADDPLFVIWARTRKEPAPKGGLDGE